MPEERLHHEDQQQYLLAIVQLQAAIRHLFQEQCLDRAAPKTINEQLEQCLSCMATALPRLTPEEVVSGCTGLGITADFSARRRIIRARRVAELADKRDQTLSACLGQPPATMVFMALPALGAMHVHAAWHALAFRGVLCLLTGTVLSLTLALGAVQVPLVEAWIVGLCAHGLAAAIVLEHRLASRVQRFAGLEEACWEPLRSQTYVLAVV